MSDSSRQIPSFTHRSLLITEDVQQTFQGRCLFICRLVGAGGLFAECTECFRDGVQSAFLTEVFLLLQVDDGFQVRSKLRLVERSGDNGGQYNLSIAVG